MTLLEMLDRLAPAMRRHGVSHLTLAENDAVLTLTLSPATATPVAQTIAPSVRQDTVPSPEMGVFRMGAIRPGSTVATGDILAFVEVGPVRLPVIAPAGGVVHTVLAQDGDTVGYHAPLFIIQSE